MLIGEAMKRDNFKLISEFGENLKEKLSGLSKRETNLSRWCNRSLDKLGRERTCPT
jgi:hypothetical protein